MNVVVIGASGNIGGGIVQGLLVKGHVVYACGQSSERLLQLYHEVPLCHKERLHLVKSSLRNSIYALQMQRKLRQHLPEFDAVVICLGSKCKGESLLEMDVLLWDEIVQNSMTALFLAIKFVFPLLRKDGGKFIHVNSFASEIAYPNAAAIGATAAAQKSIMLSLSMEKSLPEIEVHELILGPVRIRRSSVSNSEGLSLEDVADFLVSILDSRISEPGCRVHYLCSSRSSV